MVRFSEMTARRVLTLAVVGAGASVLAACASSPTVAVQAPARALAVAVQPPELTVSPADHATNVPLDAPVTVSSSTGSITTVSVVRQGGGQVPGQVAPDGHTWTATDGLDPAARYTMTVTATGTGGAHTSSTTTFSTLTHVAHRLLSSFTPADGSTVGVGEPFDLRFNTPVPKAQQAEVVTHLHVVSVPAQTGAWHWFSASEIHYRPEQFWQTGTHVTVTGDLHGVNAGNGVWGLANWSSTFIVGDKHVSLIDNNTHMMQVYDNDQLLYTWPVSLGKAGFPTLSGTLVVLYKTPKVKMSSCSTFGGAACIPGSANYYDDYVYEDTAISTNGFFIHAAPWSVASQGRVNVSHGCVNLSTDRATTFYNWSLIGDVVEISNTPNPADITNGEADWQIPFAQWDNTGTQTAATTPSPSSQGGP